MYMRRLCGCGRRIVQPDTFVCTRYSQSTVADWAVNFYLATFGRGKVGFSSSDTGDDGQARHVAASVACSKQPLAPVGIASAGQH
jgi:hypothetical protein